MRRLLLSRRQYLTCVRTSFATNTPIADHPIWHNMPFGIEVVLPVDNFEADTAFINERNLIDEEISSINNVLDHLSRTEKSGFDIATQLRVLELEDKIPDVRSVAQTYIEKQDVEYCYVGVDDVQRLCCKTAAYELANTYIGCPVEEQTIENYTLWFLRTARFNMSTEDKYNCLEGTIVFANHLIRKQRKLLGLPLRRKPSVFDRITGVISSVGEAWKANKKEEAFAPRILQTTRLLAALPYGIFGVRKMRPVKRDF